MTSDNYIRVIPRTTILCRFAVKNIILILEQILVLLQTVWPPEFFVCVVHCLKQRHDFNICMFQKRSWQYLKFLMQFVRFWGSINSFKATKGLAKISDPKNFYLFKENWRSSIINIMYECTTYNFLVWPQSPFIKLYYEQPTFG